MAGCAHKTTEWKSKTKIENNLSIMKAAGIKKIVNAPAGISHYHQLANSSYAKSAIWFYVRKQQNRYLWINIGLTGNQINYIFFFTQRHVLKYKVPNRMSI